VSRQSCHSAFEFLSPLASLQMNTGDSSPPLQGQPRGRTSRDVLVTDEQRLGHRAIQVTQFVEEKQGCLTSVRARLQSHVEHQSLLRGQLGEELIR
jgi:hypothetical protein